MSTQSVCLQWTVAIWMHGLEEKRNHCKRNVSDSFMTRVFLLVVCLVLMLTYLFGQKKVSNKPFRDARELWWIAHLI